MVKMHLHDFPFKTRRSEAAPAPSRGRRAESCRDEHGSTKCPSDKGDGEARRPMSGTRRGGIAGVGKGSQLGILRHPVCFNTYRAKAVGEGMVGPGSRY